MRSCWRQRAQYLRNHYVSWRARGRKFDFHVTATGLGARFYNIGDDGNLFGVSNKTRLNVFEMLTAVNQRAVAGNPYNGDRKLQEDAADVFEALNDMGDDE